MPHHDTRADDIARRIVDEVMDEHRQEQDDDWEDRDDQDRDDQDRDDQVRGDQVRGDQVRGDQVRDDQVRNDPVRRESTPPEHAAGSRGPAAATTERRSGEDDREDTSDRPRVTAAVAEAASGAATAAAETAKSVVGSVVRAYERRRSNGDSGADAAAGDVVIDPRAGIPELDASADTEAADARRDRVRPLPSLWSGADDAPDERRYVAVLRGGEVVVMLQGSVYSPDRAGVWLPTAPDDGAAGNGQAPGDTTGTATSTAATAAPQDDGDRERELAGVGAPAAAPPAGGGATAGPDATVDLPPLRAPEQPGRGWTADGDRITSRRRLSEGREHDRDGPDQTLKWTIAILAMVLGFGLTLGLGIAALNNSLDGQIDLWDSSEDEAVLPGQPDADPGAGAEDEGAPAPDDAEAEQGTSA